MTGYTVHTGTSKKFVNGWDNIFGKDSAAEQPAGKKKKAEKKSVKHKAKKTKK